MTWIDNFGGVFGRHEIDGHARAEFEAGARRQLGQQVDVPFAHVWTMRSGKAASFHNYVDAASWSKAWGG